ncbi:MAG: tRNA (adenosine(37)-N6)-dimethylallyltransferase MiaA [Clostridiales bacterium]|nr:tRNA (adenosine(37)-N6)-dimethylallyltransferase MiaA [Clostridiales bacterium]
MKRVLVICGATATGKTSLAVDCAKALNSEVISADSQLVYRGLNIGTAKPTFAEMQGVKHHMIDIVGAGENFSVSDYEERALPIIERLLGEDKVPVICGGTGFYINSLLYNLGYGNVKADLAVRAKYEALLEERGKEYLFGLLKEVDPETAEKLHVNDIKRVIRALEIYEVSGKKKSEQHDELKPRFDYLAVAIDYPREALYKRIDCRVDVMFNSGLIGEVEKLKSVGIDENCQSMQAIGYKEVLEGLKSGLNESTMRDIIKRNTRHYAKRQITFFKKLKGIVWLKPEQANSANKVLELLNGK